MQHGYGDEDVSGCGVSGIHYSISNPNPSTTPHYMQHQMQHLSYFSPIPVSQQVHLFQDLNEEQESSIKEPFWRPLDLDYKKEKDNYKIFSELEAICKPTSANAIAQNDEKKRKKKKKKKKRKKEQRLNSIVLFFESLTKKLIEHQEELHRKFLDAMEKKDQERMRKQEAWMKQEAEKAMARAEEQAISSARVATIVSFLENITKENANLIPDEINKDNDRTIFQEAEKEKNIVINTDIRMYSNRWPKAEGEALIGVRSKLEFMFKEAGVKGHLWEEVSSRMRRMGFNRSAKRCKEKWENINKYFRKTKDSGKARPVNSKTCPYYHQLDQLYSSSSMVASTSSELLDAIVVPNYEQVSFKFSEDEDGEYDDDDDVVDDDEEEEEEEEKGEI
ncbi:trihelix transcription factor GT-2-like [Dioscorea cayenensis subsp. rotundata]|uniref:Trihelix transcription factor GT-2-like n=1 Tax=Dioscorea cayennensis subsp. rotundata TaxID=55577 RepID=A0AB40C437_DIOCR|nr:trihelix transcription factor GT-2-like [Dioscorea cayenensis subsp. rotundata]